jgi:starch-binding outer membrane protein, SusD/RagB family
MKRVTYILLLSFIVAACNDSFLDRSPLDQISSSGVFTDKALAQAYLNNLTGKISYGLNPVPDGTDEQDLTVGYCTYPCLMASITDEARAKSGWVQNNATIVPGAISPTNTGGLDLWKYAYATIREANSIIEGINKSSFEVDFKTQISAQARFIRAFFYFDLVRRYGDIPLIKVAQSMSDDLLVARTPKAEVYDFINTELTEIAGQLPNKSELDAGKISKQAAIAINARAMLYAQRWSEAATLADLIITGSNNDGIDLFPDYGALMISHGGNIETIFEKLSLPPNAGHSFGLYNWPQRWRVAYGGQTDPTQEMVDAYEMAATGLPITDPASGYNPDMPYTGRDSRFYASIFYHGSEFSSIQPVEGEPYIDMEWNNYREGPGVKVQGAASTTGYLVKKFVDPSDGFSPKELQSKSSWQEVRFAEVLLIFAEAANEAGGPDNKVYNAINRVRTRAGLPNLPAGLSLEQMRERIRQERRVELAFENHRWFDLIRWGIAKATLDGYVPHRVKIVRKADAPSQADKPQLFEQQYFTYTYEPVPGRTQTFPDRQNLLPIPQAEIDKNSKLVQNPGY